MINHHNQSVDVNSEDREPNLVFQEAKALLLWEHILPTLSLDFLGIFDHYWSSCGASHRGLQHQRQSVHFLHPGRNWALPMQASPSTWIWTAFDRCWAIPLSVQSLSLQYMSEVILRPQQYCLTIQNEDSDILHFGSWAVDLELSAGLVAWGWMDAYWGGLFAKLCDLVRQISLEVCQKQILIKWENSKADALNSCGHMSHLTMLFKIYNKGGQASHWCICPIKGQPQLAVLKNERNNNSDCWSQSGVQQYKYGLM